MWDAAFRLQVLSGAGLGDLHQGRQLNLALSRTSSGRQSSLGGPVCRGVGALGNTAGHQEG